MSRLRPEGWTWSWLRPQRRICCPPGAPEGGTHGDFPGPLAPAPPGTQPSGGSPLPSSHCGPQTPTCWGSSASCVPALGPSSVSGRFGATAVIGVCIGPGTTKHQSRKKDEGQALASYHAVKPTPRTRQQSDPSAGVAWAVGPAPSCSHATRCSRRDPVRQVPSSPQITEEEAERSHPCAGRDGARLCVLQAAGPRLSATDLPGR